MALRSSPPILVAGLLLVAFAAPVDADLYKWTDEDGTLHFTSDPNKVPARHRYLGAEMPDDGKTAVNRAQSPAPAQGDALRQRRLDRLRAQNARPAHPPSRAPAARNTPRRMDDFAEKPPPAAKPAPQKYTRDCDHAHTQGRCKSWVNPEWKRWKRDRDAEAAPADDEFDN